MNNNKHSAHAPKPQAPGPTALAKRTLDYFHPRRKQHHIVAWVDVGWGNSLYVRGRSGGLSWDLGVPMICFTDDQWVWSYPADSGPLEIKLLRNDTDWAWGDNNVVTGKKLLVLTPQFPEHDAGSNGNAHPSNGSETFNADSLHPRR